MTDIHRVYVALGSNLKDPVAQVRRALEALQKHPHFELHASSNLYTTKAIGPEQPDYINAAVELSTKLAPEAVLDQLQAIEHAHNRERIQHWGPRTLDLDLLLYDRAVINSPRLTIPHSQIAQRNFVIQPLMDICPELQLPDGRMIADILHIIGTDGLTRLAEY